MKLAFQYSRPQRPDEEFSRHIDAARHAGLEAGWADSEGAMQSFRDWISAELQLLEKQHNGEFGPEPDQLSKQLDQTLERKQRVDSFREAYRVAALPVETPEARSLTSGAHRTLIIVTLVAGVWTAAYLLASKPGWPTYVLIALCGVLLALRPWGIGKALRSSLLKLADDFLYLLNTWRSLRLQQSLNRIRKKLQEEEGRRQRAQRWISERLEWICAQYELQRRRGEKARLLVASKAR